MTHQSRSKRRGVASVEVAILLPFMIMIIVLAVDSVSGIYRYHQIATLARAACRYASVHAGQYAEESGQPAVTLNDLKSLVINPMAVGMNPSLINVSMAWLPDGNNYPVSVTTDTGVAKQNMIRVIVSYPWQPVFMFGSPLTLTSTSEMTISY